MIIWARENKNLIKNKQTNMKLYRVLASYGKPKCETFFLIQIIWELENQNISRVAYWENILPDPQLTGRLHYNMDEYKDGPRLNFIIQKLASL